MGWFKSVVESVVEAVVDVVEAVEDVATNVTGLSKDGWLTNFVQDYVPGAGALTAAVHGIRGNKHYAQYAATKGLSTFVQAAAVAGGSVLGGPVLGGTLGGLAGGFTANLIEAGFHEVLDDSVKGKLPKFDGMRLLKDTVIGGLTGAAGGGLSKAAKTARGQKWITAVKKPFQKVGKGLQKMKKGIGSVITYPTRQISKRFRRRFPKKPPKAKPPVNTKPMGPRGREKPVAGPYHYTKKPLKSKKKEVRFGDGWDKRVPGKKDPTGTIIQRKGKAFVKTGTKRTALNPKKPIVGVVAEGVGAGTSRLDDRLDPSKSGRRRRAEKEYAEGKYNSPEAQKQRKDSQKVVAGVIAGIAAGAIAIGAIVSIGGSSDDPPTTGPTTSVATVAPAAPAVPATPGLAPVETTPLEPVAPITGGDSASTTGPVAPTTAAPTTEPSTAPTIEVTPTAIVLLTDVCYYESPNDPDNFFFMSFRTDPVVATGGSAALVVFSNVAGDLPLTSSTVESGGEVEFFVSGVEPGWTMTVSSLVIDAVSHDTFGSFNLPSYEAGRCGEVAN